MLLRAFEALRAAGVDARLTVVGADLARRSSPTCSTSEGVDVLGRVSEDEKWQRAARRRLLCAPSLRGESFGMVLTEAFAAGTPVVRSDIAGYRDVARDGVDSVLVPPGDPAALGEALHASAVDPARRERMAVAARERPQRFGWGPSPSEVTRRLRGRDRSCRGAAARPRRRGQAPARARVAPTASAPRPPAGCPRSSPPRPAHGRRRALRIARRAAVIGGAGIAGVGLAALALQRIGIGSIGDALIAATPVLGHHGALR